MDSVSGLPPAPKDATAAPRPLPFGQDLLGITFLSNDREKDVPLEYFQGEGEDNPFGEGGDNG